LEHESAVMAGLGTASRGLPDLRRLYYAELGEPSSDTIHDLVRTKDMDGTRLVLGPAKGRTRVPGMTTRESENLSETALR